MHSTVCADSSTGDWHPANAYVNKIQAAEEGNLGMGDVV
jgi:hypothetical protein